MKYHSSRPTRHCQLGASQFNFMPPWDSFDHKDFTCHTNFFILGGGLGIPPKNKRSKGISLKPPVGKLFSVSPKLLLLKFALFTCKSFTFSHLFPVRVHRTPGNTPRNVCREGIMPTIFLERVLLVVQVGGQNRPFSCIYPNTAPQRQGL